MVRSSSSAVISPVRRASTSPLLEMNTVVGIPNNPSSRATPPWVAVGCSRACHVIANPTAAIATTEGVTLIGDHGNRGSHGHPGAAVIVADLYAHRLPIVETDLQRGGVTGSDLDERPTSRHLEGRRGASAVVGLGRTRRPGGDEDREVVGTTGEPDRHG